MTLWRVSEQKLTELPKLRLDSEDRLEAWIEQDVSLLGMDLLIIGRQVRTQFGGWIDLVAIDSEGDLLIIELKKDKTPREVVAQVLDYASWISSLSPKEIDECASAYLKKPLAEAFRERFEIAIPDNVNASHRMLIVASELDDSSERIIQYLASACSLDINVVFFTCFQNNGIELVGRSWLMDPEEVEERSDSRRKVPWSGFWFINVGENEHRNWDDRIKYGFLSAGGGKVYSDSLKKLKPGDKIFAYIKQFGYVGFGTITEAAVMAKDFLVGDRRLFDLPLQSAMHYSSDDPTMSEWVVGVKWHKTFSREEAKRFPGAFANQNVVCKLREERTLAFVKNEFGVVEG